MTFDSIAIQDEKFHAQIHLKKNRAVFIDSVAIRGNATIAPVFIYNYIGVKPGDLYDESQISKISNRLRELAFVRRLDKSRSIY